MSTPTATSPSGPFATVPVGGVPLALAEPAEVLDWIDEVVRTAEPGTCRVVNHLAAHPTVEARRDPRLAAALARADCNVADGMGAVWAARLLSGGPHPRVRVYGPDAMLATIERGLDRGWRHGFVGGTEQVLPRLVANLRARHPQLRVAGAHAPPFRDVDPDTVAEDLRALGTDGPVDVLWVGLGVPKQVLWADLARAHAPARVVATVGAAFDFHAGVVDQAPVWMQERGLEWAHRLSRDPGRLWRRYLLGNAQHVAGVGRDWWQTRRSVGSGRAGRS